MADTGIWSTIHGEREALAQDLSNISADQWHTASLCDRWTVQDVLAHMTGTARMTPGKFVGKFIISGFSIKRVQARDIAAIRGDSPSETLAQFKKAMGRTSSPPGPKTAWLGETIVHAEDIRRTLGIKREYPAPALTKVADFYKSSNALIGSKKRIAGLKLQATDTDWTTGDGPAVSGPMISLLLAMTGRKAAIADLSGEGVAQLLAR